MRPLGHEPGRVTGAARRSPQRVYLMDLAVKQQASRELTCRLSLTPPTSHVPRSLTHGVVLHDEAER